ncbi:hypothetical protein BaRGS_00011772 [Batillaria attramentaria]|uniref:Uncharacterized protein n=1 Tax=Batillaria attramentaria TaxID=370345 RepID=A0ABD0LBS8_9CAEN
MKHLTAKPAVAGVSCDLHDIPALGVAQLAFTNAWARDPQPRLSYIKVHCQGLVQHVQTCQSTSNSSKAGLLYEWPKKRP